MKSSDQKVTRVNFPKMDANPQLVVLTLEEAKAIQRMFDDLIEMHSRGSIRIEAEGFETIYMVKYRIEQVEKKE